MVSQCEGIATYFNHCGFRAFLHWLLFHNCGRHGFTKRIKDELLFDLELKVFQSTRFEEILRADIQPVWGKPLVVSCIIGTLVNGISNWWQMSTYGNDGIYVGPRALCAIVRIWTHRRVL